jgi:hypothetical protein
VFVTPSLQRKTPRAVRTGASNVRTMKEATSASNDRNLWGASFFPRLPAPAQMLTESAEAARWLYFGMGPDPFEEVEGGAYVLQPPAGVPPLAVLHFVGGTFVGASPQITYRCFLQKLAARGMVVVATPFDAGFDNGRIADQVRQTRCMNVGCSADVYRGPIP